jgi:hypothetical protein
VARGLFNARITALGRIGINEQSTRGQYDDVKPQPPAASIACQRKTRSLPKGQKRSPRSGSTLFGRATQNVRYTMLSCAHPHILQMDQHGNSGPSQFEGVKQKAICPFGGGRRDRKGNLSG